MLRAELTGARTGEAPRSVAEDARGVATTARRLADLFDAYAGALAGEAGGARERELYLGAMGELRALKEAVRALSDRVAKAHAGRPAGPPDCE
jgi:hypothetical protein